MPCVDEEPVCEVLVGTALDRLDVRHEHDGAAEVVTRLRQLQVVEVGQRHDQADVVEHDEVSQRRDVARVVDPWHERVPVGMVERGRELVDVGRDRRRACARERGDDVDALARAREQDGRHDRGG